MKPHFAPPKPLKGSDANSFAYSTIAERLPRMVDRIIEEENFAIGIRRSLDNLKASITHSSIRPLTDFQAPDSAQWDSYIAKYQGKNWFEVPWFFSETYFYRRVLESTKYFLQGPSFHHDPFTVEKQRSLRHDWDEIRSTATNLLSSGSRIKDPMKSFCKNIYAALWGNQADLSMWTSASGLQPKTEGGGKSEFLLIDQSESAHQYLTSLPAGPKQIDFILDNIGLELLGDLCLADHFLNDYSALQIVFHVKPHPTFISDAIDSDVSTMIYHLAMDPLNLIRDLGVRLKTYLEKGQLVLATDWFWTSPLSGWEMPRDLSEQLRKSDLVVWKGDANYRRLLGDRHWPYHTPFADIISYAPTAFLALRTMKANVVCGLPITTTKSLQEFDPDWMINGKWGLIQFETLRPRDT